MSHYRRFVLLLGLGIITLSIVLSVIGDLTRQLHRLYIVFGLMYVFYITAVALLSRVALPDRRMLALVFVVAVVSRIALLPATPSLSDDIYRYAWEGRVVRAGYNPFSHPPDSSELERLRNAAYNNVNHKHMETIYPPLAQGLFTIGAFAGQGVIWQKILFFVFDLASLVVLVFLIRARGGNPAMVAVYGWSPLVLIEFSHSGHMDPLAMFFFLLALFLFDRMRNASAASAMALSFLAKFVAIFLVPFLIMRRRYSRSLLLFGLIVVMGYVPFAGAGGKLFASLATYSRHWDFNAFAFSVMRQVLDNPDAVRVALAAAAGLFAIYQGYRQRDLFRYAFLVVGCALLASPTLYPWYVCWIIPFLCLYRSRAWLYLTGIVVLSYQVWPDFRDTGVWQVGWGALFIEYVPFIALLAYDGYKKGNAGWASES